MTWQYLLSKGKHEFKIWKSLILAVLQKNEQVYSEETMKTVAKRSSDKEISIGVKQGFFISHAQEGKKEFSRQGKNLKGNSEIIWASSLVSNGGVHPLGFNKPEDPYPSGVAGLIPHRALEK